MSVQSRRAWTRLRAFGFTVLLLAGQFVTLGCGMANPALAAVFDGGESNAMSEMGAGAADHHDMAHSDAGSSGHHGGDSDSNDCLTSLSCTASAATVQLVFLSATVSVLGSGHEVIHDDASSADLPLLRPPPRRV